MLNDEQNSKADKLERILIIEDDGMMIGLLTDILSPSYTVTSAGTVTRGLEKSFIELPDLIICDIKLPDGNGLDIVSTLKQNQLSAHIPVIIISSLDSEEDVINGLEQGADDYITKPFSNNELIVRVKTQLENRRRIINWYRHQFANDKLVIHNNLPSKEQQFVDKLKEISQTLIHGGELSIDTLAREMAHSKRQLQRKVKEHLNCSCGDYIFGLRMNYAESLSLKGYTIKEITAMTGYKDVAHFSRIFKKHLRQRDDN